jgi:hypothetical protein
MHVRGSGDKGRSSKILGETCIDLRQINCPLHYEFVRYTS